VLDVLTPVVVEATARGGYILDGFPRTLPQATVAAELAARLGVTLDAAVYLYAPEEVLTLTHQWIEAERHWIMASPGWTALLLAWRMRR
jgi:adenylate kinase family enzyme